MRQRDAYDIWLNNIQDDTNQTSRNAQTTRMIYKGTVVDINDTSEQNRVRVFIPELDRDLERDKNKLAWCQYFFASNIQHIPKIGETVAVILENPWKKDHGRWWVGPIFDDRTIAVPLDSVALTARSGNSMELKDDGNIEISTDTNKARLDAEATIYFNKSTKELRAAAFDIILESTISDSNDEFAVPYGERLVELLRFILQTLKTHSHPPNAPPKPTFFVQADDYLHDLEDWLLNKNVRTRGR
jgi:hypothetical protein